MTTRYSFVIEQHVMHLSSLYHNNVMMVYMFSSLLFPTGSVVPYNPADITLQDLAVNSGIFLLQVGYALQCNRLQFDGGKVCHMRP